MSKLREAALAVLDRWDGPTWSDLKLTAFFMEDLRTALDDEIAQVAEPVAWWVVSKTTDEKYVSTRPDDWSSANWEKRPLYLHPPQQVATPDIAKLTAERDALMAAAKLALDVLERASDAGYSIECIDAMRALTKAGVK